jgi:hypothetical protein
MATASHEVRGVLNIFVSEEKGTNMRRRRWLATKYDSIVELNGSVSDG